MTYRVQVIHRKSVPAASNLGVERETSYSDWEESFNTLDEALAYARAQAAQVTPEWEPKSADMWTFGVWPYAIERPAWKVYEEPEPDTPEWDACGGFCKFYDIIDPLEPMRDLLDLLSDVARGCGSIGEQLAYDLGDEIDLREDVADLDDEERQPIERRRLSLVSFGCTLAPSGRSWALLEDGRCCGLLGGLETMHPSAYDALRADWWSADDCDLSTAQGKQAAAIYSIIADAVSWR